MLSVAIAGVLAMVGGHRGRHAAVRGLSAVGATSIVANLIVNPEFARRRPKPATQGGARGPADGAALIEALLRILAR